jgi:transcriptional regulator with XRE-family HTH domain
MGKSIRTKEYQDFAQRLRKARSEAGLTQVEVAKKLKRPQSYISKAEAGEQRLDIVELKKFASLYKKDLSYFIK